MPRLSQKLEQKQKLAPRQVLQARLLQLNTLNLEQAILKELELNPILEQVEPEDFEEKSMAEEILEEMEWILLNLWKKTLKLEKMRVFLSLQMFKI